MRKKADVLKTIFGSHEPEYRQITKKELQSGISRMAKIANTKIKEVYKRGYQNYNQSFIKKYNILLNNKVNPNIATKAGYFRTGTSKDSIQSLAMRYNILEEFINNKYATADYTAEHLNEMSSKWGIKSEEAMKQMFDLYREYGYQNYTDSDKVLTSMAKIVSDAELYEYDDPGQMLEAILQEIDDNMAVDAEGRTITQEDYIKELQSQAGILK